MIPFFALGASARWSQHCGSLPACLAAYLALGEVVR